MATRERQKLEFSPFNAKLISHKHFEVTRLQSLSDEIVKLQISNVELGDYDFPRDAEISVMVKRGTENLITVSLGTIGDINTRPFEVDFENKAGQVTCRVNVTNPGETPFIGISQWRHPKHANNEGLFDFRDEDLGDLVWNFELPIDDFAKPAFVYNKTIPDLMDRIFQDILLFSSIFPTCLKIGMEHILFNSFSSISIEGTWQNIWWQYAADRMENTEEILETDDQEKKLSWCIEVSKRFAEEQQFRDLILDYLKLEDE